MQRRITIAAIILVLAAVVLGISSNVPAAGAQKLDRAAKAEPAQAEVEKTIAARADAVFELSPKQIEKLVAIQADGRQIEEVVRVFSQGAQIEYAGLVYGLARKSGTYYPDRKSLVVRGEAFGTDVVEDVRFLELDGARMALVRDIYLDGQGADLSVGRGLPFEIVGGDDRSADTRKGDYGVRASAAAVANPSISSISGYTSSAAGISNGKVAMGSCGGAWDGSYAINDQPGTYRLTLNGANFGASRGSVTLAGRSVTVTSWSDRSIVIDPTMPYDSYPVCALLKVTTAAGRVLNYGLNVVPAIRTRIYGQCTYHVAWNRLRMGKSPSPTAYGGYSSITGDYVPAVGDQYQFHGGSHTAIVVGVSGPALSTGGVKTWTLTVSEQNADCRNGVRQYSAEFKSKTVGTTKSVMTYPRASYGGYYSTLYYR